MMLVKLVPVVVTTLLASAALAVYHLPGTQPETKPAPTARPQHAQVKVTKLAEVQTRQQGVTIDPYLVDRTSESVTLAWRTATAQESVLWYGEASAATTRETSAGFQHAVTIEGLDPDRAYAYQVSGFAPGVFRTLPAEGPVSFAILGHTHGSEHSQHYPDEILAAKVHETRPQFVVHAGDCVYHSDPAGWAQDFFAVFREVLQSAPIYISPGNHDSGWPFLQGYDLRPFRSLFPHPYPDAVGTGPEHAFYRVHRGPVALFFLSYVDRMDRDSVQFQWLRQELLRSQADFHFVVFGGMNRYYDEAQVFAQLAELPVDLVINGDGSAPTQPFSEVAGVRRLSLGTANERPHPWVSARATAESVSLKVLYADGTFGPTQTLLRSKEDPAGIRLQPGESKALQPKHTRVVLPLPTGTTSDRTKRLQVRLASPPPRGGTAYVYFRAKENVAHAEMGLRSQYITFTEQNTLLSFAVPPFDPQTNKPYELLEVHCHFVGVPAEQLPKVQAAWIVHP